MTKYSDFRNNFDIHPVKSDLTLLTDDAAITNSIKNLVMTAPYERPFQPEIGAGIPQTLFDNMNAETEYLLSTRIREVIEKYEPRAIIREIKVAANIDRNGYQATIIYTPINTTQPVVVDMLLKRVR